MLQWINDRMKVIGWIFILPLALVFAVWGVQGIVNFTSSQDRGLKVNGEDVNVDRIRQVYQEQYAQLSRLYPDEVPADVKKSTQDALVEEFVNTTLLAQKVKALRYHVSDADVLESIQRYPAFQVGGQFSKDAYYGLLRAQGYSPERFEAERREELRSRSLEVGLFVSSFATARELSQSQALLGEKRELAYAVLPLARFLAAAKPDEAAVKAYYEAHQESFKTPDSVHLSYVELKVADIEKAVVVDEPAIKGYFETVKDRYLEPERREARHILIQGQDEAAKKKAEEVYALAAKPGADFAALAKQYSQDAGSAAQGGDLGFAERSFFVGPFADAVFTMQPGQVKGPVKTQFGYHVIKLEAIQPGKIKPFDEIRPELEREYRKAEADRRFGELQEKLEQLAFESSGSLEPVAKALGVAVRDVPEFYKGLAGDALAQNTKVVQAAFSADVLGGQNSRPIELTPGDVVVLRASDRRLPAQQPLEAVRAKATDGARAQLAEQAAKAAAEKLASAVAGGAKWDAALQPLGPLAPAGKTAGPE
ncbi:MAG: SurA N-terminal domain-containing protein, partial [Proteobacteria bacterium]|nr:SurA N-terminal domain-containing protein [Pseudomonadota bacterium]